MHTKCEIHTQGNNMDPLPNIDYIHVQAKTNDIIIIIYLVNVLYASVLGKRVDKDFGPLIN